MEKKVRAVVMLFLVATSCALFVRLFLYEVYRISSNSMIPNLYGGDLVLVSKFNFSLKLPFSAYELVKFRKPQRGEVVTFQLPDRSFSTFVKRVVAVEGDTVVIEDGKLLVNGVAPGYSPFKADTFEGSEWEEFPDAKPYLVVRHSEALKNYGPIDLPTDHFFALGDNRSDSLDSRTWGPVPYSCLKGKVAMIWFSVSPEGGIRPNRLGVGVQ